MSENNGEKEVYFTHPVTGAQHKLYFQNAKSMTVPIDPGQKRELYIMQVMYEIEPALPQGDTLQFDSTVQHRVEYNVSGSGYFPDATSSIGIIGGADGPTSVFFSSRKNGNTVPCGVHGLPLHSCFSVPSFTREDSFHFHMEGINTIFLDGQEITFGIE